MEEMEESFSLCESSKSSKSSISPIPSMCWRSEVMITRPLARPRTSRLAGLLSAVVPGFRDQARISPSCSGLATMTRRLFSSTMWKSTWLPRRIPLFSHHTCGSVTTNDVRILCTNLVPILNIINHQVGAIELCISFLSTQVRIRNCGIFTHFFSKYT
jgi:hypothetical protein